VKRRRPRGILQMGWAAWACQLSGRGEHCPVALEYPPERIERFDFRAGGERPWRLSALRTPRLAPPPWRIVVVTGAPSWAEYWAPVLAAMPQDREMVVVDRPGFACSEPHDCVPDIEVQAAALMPLLEPRAGQRVLLVGQSYGAAIATLMAAAAPDRVDSLLLLSGFFGELGPMARALVELGARCWPVVPRDLRNAITEVRGQAPQLAKMTAALETLTMPVTSVHGDRDDFAPLAVAETLCRREKGGLRFAVAPGADHFLNDGPVEPLIAQLEAAIPQGAPTLALAPDEPTLSAQDAEEITADSSVAA
jgi:pimeloyl-ACP methyl ester carboxylesterase